MMSIREQEIPSGSWQRIIGGCLISFGLFAALAATPFNGAAAAATLCITAGGSLLFWGIMLRYLSILERKIDGLAPDRPGEI